MMDWTDNNYRTLARLISRHAWLYTEMVVAETIVHQKDSLVSLLLLAFLGPVQLGLSVLVLLLIFLNP
jgi:tRNA-dihydrouridine synthase